MSHIAMVFESVSQMLRAGKILKESGFCVLVIPRKITGCGVLLLVESEFVTSATALLATQGIKPTELFDYKISHLLIPSDEIQ